MPNTNTNKIIYSLRVNIELQKNGFKPILTMENPYKPGFMCWVYETSPEFNNIFDIIMKEG